MKSLRCVLVLVVGLLWTVHAPAARADTRVTAGRATATATLVHQELALAADGPLTIQFHPAEPLGTNTVSILAYRPIALRDTLKQAIAHRLTGFVDRVDLEPSTLAPDADGNITITVQTETSGDSTGALLLPDAGLYPLAVRILDTSGDIVDELITFVARQPAAGSPPAATISLAVLASVTAPPSLPGSATPLPADVGSEITSLAAYSPDVHLSLSISPEILTRLDPATLDALHKALPNSALLSQPLVPFDPSTATASGLQDRFRQLLVDGDNTVANSGLAPPTRAVWYAPTGITDAGAQLLREAGVRLLVVPSDTYLAADGNIGALTDYSQLFKSVFSSDATAPAIGDQTCDSSAVACMPTAVIDPLMASRLADPSLSPEQAAMYTAADVVVYREQFADSLSSSRHALVLGPNGDGVADAARINRTVQMVGATDAVQFITLDQLEQNSSSLIIDGRPVELHLPSPDPADLTSRARSLNEVALAATTVSSMLVEDNGRTAGWTNTINTLYSTAVTDDQVAASIRDLNGQLAAIRQCVVAPRSDTFTLTGRSTNLPLQIGNTCDEALYVVVRLDAAADKMEFPDPDPKKLLQPLTPNNIFPIPVTARTNGTFDVTLDLITPTGDAKVADSVTLKARVNTLTGLPQLLTGAALLILLTWWVRNLRRSRRQRRSLAVASALANSTHPAVQAEKAAPPRSS